jgi:hypothetical protein
MTQIPVFMVEAGAQTQPFADLVSAYQFALQLKYQQENSIH